MPGIATGNMLGNGLQFNGGQYVDLPESSLLQFQYANNYSISMILRLTSFGSYTLFAYGHTSNNGFYGSGYAIYTFNRTIRFIFLSGGNLRMILECTIPVSYNSGDLLHLCITKTGVVAASDFKFYINSTLLTHSVLENNFPNITVDYSLARASIGMMYAAHTGNYSQNPFTGQIFDLKIFNKSLSQLEIFTDYKTDGKKVNDRGSLLAHWRFDEREGRNLKDYTANNLTGTLNNFSLTIPSPTNKWIDGVNFSPILYPSKKVGNGLKFLSASTTRAQLNPLPASLKFQPLDGFSIAVSFYNNIQDGSAQTIFDTRSAASGGKGYVLYRSSGNYVFGFNNGGSNYIVSFPAYVGYCSFIITKQAGSLNQFAIYRNGFLEAGNVTSNELIDSPITYDLLDIGTTSYTGVGRYFQGVIYDLKMWNLPINADSAKTFADSEHSLNLEAYENNLVLDFTFDENSGNTLTDLVAGNNAVISNANTTLGINNQWVDHQQQPILI